MRRRLLTATPSGSCAVEPAHYNVVDSRDGHITEIRGFFSHHSCQAKDAAMALNSRMSNEARQEISWVARLGLAPDALASALMEIVGRVVPSDGYRLFALDPASRLITRLLAASDDDAWARVEWLRDVYLATDPLTYIEHDRLTRLALPVVVVNERQEQCWGFPDKVLGRVSPSEHRARFHEIRSPVGGSILAHFEESGRWVAAVQLYRRDATRPFTRRDGAMMRSIQPEMSRALAAALSREHASTIESSDLDAAGVLLLAPDYRVTLCTPAGEAWLSRLHDTDRDGHAPLPTAIWAAVAALRGAPETSAQAVVAPTVYGLLRVEASTAGTDGSMAVVLAPHRSLPQPGLPPDWNLTRQERRVIEQVLHGRSNREIADALFVSENTVEYHLRHAYEKLGVRSRSQVMARYFRDSGAAGHIEGSLREHR